MVSSMSRHHNSNGNTRLRGSYKPVLRLLTGAALLSLSLVTAQAIPLKNMALDPQHAQAELAGSNPMNIKGRKYSEQFTQANALILAGEHQKLLELAQSVLSQDPDAELALEVKAVALILMGKFAQAQSALEHALQSAPQQTSLWVRLGVAQMEQGKINEAKDSFHKALALEPNNPQAHQRLGLLYEFTKETPLAIRHLRIGLEGVPVEKLGVAVNLANLLNGQRQYDEAIAVLAPRLPSSLTVYEAHMVLGTAYLGVNQYEKAFKRFESAQLLRPGDFASGIGQARALRGEKKFTQAIELLNNLAKKHANAGIIDLERGETYLGIDDYQAAQKAFDSAIKQGQSAESIERRMVRYLMSNGDHKTAKKRLDAAIKQYPEEPSFYAQLSEINQATGDHKAGIAILTKGIERLPDNAALRFKLGTYYAALGNYEQASQALKTALDYSPGSPTTLRALIMTQRKAGDNAGAVKSAEHLVELFHKSNAPDLLLLATALEANQELARAQAVYAQALAEEPNNVLALNNLASLMSENGDLETAESYARKAVALKEDNASILDTLGWILFKQSKYEAALEQFKIATRLEPQMANLWYHKGRTLAALGQRQEAKVALKKALAISKRAPWALEAKKIIDTL